MPCDSNHARRALPTTPSPITATAGFSGSTSRLPTSVSPSPGRRRHEAQMALRNGALVHRSRAGLLAIQHFFDQAAVPGDRVREHSHDEHLSADEPERPADDEGLYVPRLVAVQYEIAVPRKRDAAGGEE